MKLKCIILNLSSQDMSTFGIFLRDDESLHVCVAKTCRTEPVLLIPVGGINFFIRRWSGQQRWDWIKLFLKCVAKYWSLHSLLEGIHFGMPQCKEILYIKPNFKFIRRKAKVVNLLEIVSDPHITWNPSIAFPLPIQMGGYYFRKLFCTWENLVWILWESDWFAFLHSINQTGN